MYERRRAAVLPYSTGACLDQTNAGQRAGLGWAGLHGYHYVFTDDAFFDYAPAWVRQRCKTQFFPVTDIARLHYIQAYLDKGYQRVVWVDADVLVFDPKKLDIRQPGCHAVVPAGCGQPLPFCTASGGRTAATTAGPCLPVGNRCDLCDVGRIGENSVYRDND